MTYYLTVGVCPFCNTKIPNPTMVNLLFNNGAVIPQPVCETDAPKLLKYDIQVGLLQEIKEIWKKEIDESTQLTVEDKEKEKLRIDKIEIAGSR